MKLTSKVIYVVCITIFLISSCKVAENIFCYNYNGRPDVTLTYKEIVSMLGHFDQTKRKRLQFGNGGDDTRVNHFKIEDLKSYLAYVEKLSKDKEIQVTGINIISAAYPSDYKEVEKRGYQTLIFMPTTTINGKEGVSFDPLHSEIGKPKPFADILREYNYELTYFKNSKEAEKHKNTKRMMMKKFSTNSSRSNDELSSAANRLGISPPLDKK